MKKFEEQDNYSIEKENNYQENIDEEGINGE